MSKTKKTIVLLLIGIVCVAGLYFVWRVVFGTPLEENATTENGEKNTLPSGTTNAENGVGGSGENIGGEGNGNENTPTADALGDTIPTLEKLSNQEIVFFWVNKKTNEVFYTTREGNIYLAKEMGDQKISPQSVGIIYSLEPNQTGEKILAFFGERDSQQSGIFDVIDKTWAPLPSEILNATWGTSEKKLFGLVRVGLGKDLVEINTGKTPLVYKTLLKDFVLNDVLISVAPNDRIFIYERSGTFYPPKLWEFNPRDASLSLIIQSAPGGVFGFSKDMKNVFTLFPDKKQLSIITNSLKTTAYADFFTIPDKCDMFASTTYCFVPEEQKDVVGFFDAYEQRKIFTSDTLMKFNLSTNEIGVLSASGALPYKTDASHVLFFENYVYFKNRYDNFLYRLNISKEL